LETAAGQGFNMTWNHFERLASVDEDDVRKQLEDAVISQRLTIKQLEARIQEQVGYRQLGCGRTPAPPKDYEEGMKQIIEFSQQYGRRIGGWDTVVFEHLNGLSKADARLVNRLTHLVKIQKRHVKDASHVLSQCRRVIDHVNEIVAKRTSAAHPGASTKRAPKRGRRAGRPKGPG
jgi:hypothetical protein